MSVTEQQKNEIISSHKHKRFTFGEAIEFMKWMDTMPTTSPIINWVNADTRQPVSIGYTS